MVDGWVLTGDIGMIDKNGYLYLLDRAADMIISGGFNIWPMELENAIATHPAVMEVAVFGIPDPRWGETPCAVVVPKSGRTIDVAEVMQLCAEQLGSYKKPGSVVIRDEPLPKTPVGKIKRRELREPFWAGHVRRRRWQLKASSGAHVRAVSAGLAAGQRAHRKRESGNWP